ncbi:MAG TPA: 50S ribosomal protein L18 [bacterium]|nr:50S ribosomal protein L18 [bacterium]
MNQQKIKKSIRQRRHRRVRAKIFGTGERPRLSVYRSLNHISAQLIDDSRGVTLVAATDQEIKQAKTKTDQATAVGKLLAERAAQKKINQAVFDKGFFKYHGRIKALADSAREQGLKI